MAHRFGGRPKFALGLVAAILALSTSAPGFAQSAPTSNAGGVWKLAADATGANTYVGRVETPRPGQAVQAGANLLVSGWAADTTASGWAGFDQMQVYSGDKATGGAKVADGSVGLSRPDVADALGPNYAKTGFSAVVPAGTLSGSATLFVYLHTGSKGWIYRTVGVNQQGITTLEFPSDPIVNISKPCCAATITTAQFFNRYVIVGYALDRNPVTDPANQSKLAGPVAGPGEAGIQSVMVYLDLTPGMAGYNPAVNFIGNAGLGIEDLASAQGPAAGPVHTAVGKSTITRVYGPQYEFAGWVLSWDPRSATPNTEHTIFAVGRSSISGKTSTASTSIFLKQSSSNPVPCSVLSGLTHHQGCSILSG